MDEYTLEMRSAWATQLHGFPQNGFVSKLFAEVPKPPEAQIRKALPFWELTPLQCKLPDLGIEGVYFTRGKAGHSSTQAALAGPTQDVDFITYDPHCYEHDSRKYDAMHDRHLENFFKSEKLCAFLRKIGLLDSENFPKCSVGEMNAYRQYLFRVHKDKVKREYNRILDEKDENRLWKNAHINSVKHYFRKFHQEVRMLRTMSFRKEIARQERAKAMKPLQLLKRWDRRLKEFEELKKDAELVKEEQRDRESRRYRKVIERGRANLEIRPMKTLRKMRDQKLKADEAMKKKQDQDQFEKYTNIESYLFNKSLVQFNKLELLKQLAILYDKGKEVTRKKNELAAHRIRKRFQQQLYCRRNNKLPERMPSPEITQEAQKNMMKYNRRMELGIKSIIQVLSTLESQQAGLKKALPIKDPILKKVANQMIKRAVLMNLQCSGKHLVTIVMNYCLAPVDNLVKLLPIIKQDGSFLVPTEKCLKEADIMPEMKEVIHTFVVSGHCILEKVNQTRNTSGLRAFFIHKHQLFITILANARRLVQLVEDRMQVLKSVKDPYYNLPYLKQEIMKYRKISTFKELSDKLYKILTVSNPKMLETPDSGLGEVANIIAYAKVALNHNIIHDKESETAPSGESTWLTPPEWERLLNMHKFMKENYDELEEENEEQQEELDAVNEWIDQAAQRNLPQIDQ